MFKNEISTRLSGMKLEPAPLFAITVYVAHALPAPNPVIFTSTNKLT